MKMQNTNTAESLKLKAESKYRKQLANVKM